MPARDQLLQSAEKNIAKGKTDQALKDYLRVLDENPNDISILNRVGDLYVRMNRAAESIPFFVRIAEFCALDGFFLKAIAIYKKINKLDPARLDIYDRLGDLYSKQGLSQDARSHYQILADHYQRNGIPEEAIATYKKMAAVDPNDLKIQVRLADLYRSINKLDQAVMQYGLVGSMLLRRGAQEEAAAVFQKALELSPQDASARNSLVRSLLAQKNPATAIAIAKAAPRTADSLALIAEAQFELGQPADAGRTAEQALALDSRHEAARLLLCRVHLAEADFEQALADVSPLVDAASVAGDFPRAASYLAAILQREEAHRESLRKMAEIRDAEGNVAEASRMRLALAREEERLGETAAAIENYRRVIAASPGETEASRRLAELSRSPVAPAEELIIEIEEPQPVPGAVLPAGGGSAETAPMSPEDREIETLIVEAEIFARYGLTDKAVDRLRALVRRRPDLLRARERLIDLMAESKNPALRQEAEALAGLYREQGRPQEAQALMARLGLAYEPAEAAPRPDAFEEFPLEPRAAAAPDYMEDFGAVDAPPPPGPPPPLARPTPAEPEFVAYEELDSLLEKEMQKAGEVSEVSKVPRRPAAPPLDEKSLFADEQQFFNLAEELEKDLAEEVPAPAAPEMAGPQGEASLEEIFREFKKGVELQLSAEDYETHSNLGIAYKEMGLIDEAIGEFQLASRDPDRAVECCSMLGLCFLEKGMPQLAVKWYRRGLEAPGIKESETVGLLYDLARIYQSTGDLDLAYRTFLEVFGMNTSYRDVSQRVRELEAVKKD